MGPNLAAILSYFSGRHHLGKRGIEELVETVFEVPISLGMVTTLESEMSAALAPAHDEAKDEVRAAAVKNADETGWKQAGRRCWLWMAATATVAYFVIHARRNVAGLQALLGEAIQGIVGSDRWGAYNKLPLHQRQICWAHLKRDFQKLIDRGGPAEAIGRVGMDVVECLFADWWAFRRGDLDRAGLQRSLDPMAPNSKRLWSRVVAARTRKRWRSARMSWCCIRRCGCSRRSRGWNRRTTMRNGSCGWVCCGGRTRSGVTARRDASSRRGC